MSQVGKQGQLPQKQKVDTILLGRVGKARTPDTAPRAPNVKNAKTIDKGEEHAAHMAEMNKARVSPAGKLSAQKLVHSHVAQYTKAFKKDPKTEKVLMRLDYWGGTKKGTPRNVLIAEWLPTKQACFWGYDPNDPSIKKIYHLDLISSATVI